MGDEERISSFKKVWNELLKQEDKKDTERTEEEKSEA